MSYSGRIWPEKPGQPLQYQHIILKQLGKGYLKKKYYEGASNAVLI